MMFFCGFFGFELTNPFVILDEIGSSFQTNVLMLHCVMMLGPKSQRVFQLRFVIFGTSVASDASRGRREISICFPVSP